MGTKANKFGFVKHDLYLFDTSADEDVAWQFSDSEWMTQEQKEKFLTSVSKMFIRVKKGTKVYCFLDDGEESWIDDEGWVGGQDAEWAEQHLENVHGLD